jgi:hypothetical protein
VDLAVLEVVDISVRLRDRYEKIIVVDRHEGVDKKGVFTSFDPPGATGSTASTVNPSGAVVGSYDTTVEGTCSTQCQGYLLYHGTFTTIDFPGAIFTFGGGNNPEGDIVGKETDTFGVGHSFLLSNGVFTSFDPVW